MTTTPVPVSQSLGVWLLPATAAYDYERWQDSLVNPGLLLDAVAVALYRLPLLAVPAGADRRGGYMDMPDPDFAEELVCALRGRLGFDRLTVFDHVVRWGEPLPEDLTPDAHRRFHGLCKQSRLGAWIRPPAGHGGRGLGAGRCPPAPGPPPGRQPLPPRAVVQAGAATTP